MFRAYSAPISSDVGFPGLRSPRRFSLGYHIAGLQPGQCADAGNWHHSFTRCLPLPSHPAILAPVQLPDLHALQRGDAAAWDAAFPWLWPAAFGAAHVTLHPYLPADVEDVAIEALEKLVEKVRDLKSVEELKPLVASIAHHRAVSRLRQHFAAKRGSGQTESLEAKQQETGELAEGVLADSPLAALEQKELAAILRQLLAELKPPQGELLADFFLHGLSYEEMAKKHDVATGSVGVYLKRGLEAVRRAWERRGE